MILLVLRDKKSYYNNHRQKNKKGITREQFDRLQEIKGKVNPPGGIHYQIRRRSLKGGTTRVKSYTKELEGRQPRESCTESNWGKRITGADGLSAELLQATESLHDIGPANMESKTKAHRLQPHVSPGAPERLTRFNSGYKLGTII